MRHLIISKSRFAEWISIDTKADTVEKVSAENDHTLF